METCALSQRQKNPQEKQRLLEECTRLKEEVSSQTTEINIETTKVMKLKRPIRLKRPLKLQLLNPQVKLLQQKKLPRLKLILPLLKKKLTRPRKQPWLRRLISLRRNLKSSEFKRKQLFKSIIN